MTDTTLIVRYLVKMWNVKGVELKNLRFVTLVFCALLCVWVKPVFGESEYHEYCIIGAGPAGLQMGYFLQKSQRDYIIFEKSHSAGSFFLKYPIHRKLISINKIHTGKVNKEFNLRHDWNSLLSDDDRMLFRHFSDDMFPHADDMVRYLQTFAKHFNLSIQYKTEISDINPETKRNESSTILTMKDQYDRSYSCRILIVATGMWKPNIPDIPGIDLVEGYENLSLNTTGYIAKSVLIFGRGNSAFETANALYGKTNFIHMVGRHRIRLAWETHYVGDLRAVNNELLDTYQLKSMDGLIEYDLLKYKIIRENNKLYLKENVNSSETMEDYDNDPLLTPYDKIIRCTGFVFDASIFRRKAGLLSGPYWKYPTIDYDFRSSSVDGLYFAGTASHSLDYKQSAGGFVHGFRYTARVLHKILGWRYHGEKWPFTVHQLSELSSVICKRVNEASGIYQMYSFLGDIALVNKQETFEYIEEFPVKILNKFTELTGISVADKVMFVILLQYGVDFHGPLEDVFREDRAATDPKYAHLSNFLHPVIHFFETMPTDDDMMAMSPSQPVPHAHRVHHMLEDFTATWNRPQSHVQPLHNFLNRCLNKMKKSSMSCTSHRDCFGRYFTTNTTPKHCFII